MLWEMPQHKGNLQECKGKGGRGALPVPLLSECKGVDLFLNCLDPHRLTEAELCLLQCLLLWVAKLV